MNKKEQLILAAIELFGRHGIQSVGIDKIIKHAKVAKMTLYHHFSSKEELLLSCLRRVDEELIFKLNDFLKKSPGPFEAGNYGDDFFHYYISSLREMGFRGCFFARVASELNPIAPGSEDLFRCIHDYRRRLNRIIRQKLKESRKDLANDEEALIRQTNKLLMILDAMAVSEYFDNDQSDNNKFKEVIGDII